MKNTVQPGTPRIVKRGLSRAGSIADPGTSHGGPGARVEPPLDDAWGSRFEPTAHLRTIALAAFPAMLTELDQWVVWRAEKRSLGSGEIKWTKVPYVAGTHRKASSTDPETWATFADARADAQRPGLDAPWGVGFVFSADDPFTGVDLDACFLDDGKLHPAARALVTGFHSYTELSPSGNGVHIITEERVSFSGKRTSNTAWGGVLEAYSSGRYFTITGAQLCGL